MGLALGLSLADVKRPSGGSSPPAYATGAVSFDGATLLSNAALTVTPPSPTTFLQSIWFEILTPASSFGVAWVIDPLGEYYSNLAFSDVGAINTGVYDVTNNAYVYSTPTSDATLSTWHNLLTAAHTDTGDYQLYLDDVNITGAITTQGVPFDMAIGGLPFYVGGDATVSDYLVGNLADVFIAPGQYLDLSVVANRRKFISAAGKPVDLGSDGSTPTGTTPAVFLRRAPAAAASTFATNLGTGGNFGITGTLTNAPSSPSD